MQIVLGVLIIDKLELTINTISNTSYRLSYTFTNKKYCHIIGHITVDNMITYMIIIVLNIFRYRNLIYELSIHDFKNIFKAMLLGIYILVSVLD